MAKVIERSGLTGGDWEIVKEILEFCPESIEFYVYEIWERL